ncbi:MAG: carboxypeptidase-like regulatory domain-containing protein [Ignavibacteriales bacterium]|nr:carboxypeptidase-like regulatory domain-containing protein [Ignavibacteriales bacterium]
MRKLYNVTLILTLLLFSQTYAQYGKLVGKVTDAKTNEPLFGASVVVQGTTLGGITNAEGEFLILKVSPGNYDLKATMIGYAPITIKAIVISISQTTQQDFALTELGLQTAEVTVVASRPIVQRDVSASTLNLTIQEMENLPIANVQNILTLQAGILTGTDGVSVRGGGADQTTISLNGLSLKDERTNISYSGISMTSIEAVQVLTGGFNAEYGNIRSGQVNIVTRDGSKDKYYVSFSGRYRGAAPKNFGGSPNDKDAYWIRPFLDPQVAFVGTKTGWANDPHLQAQYPEFEGWIKAAKTYNDQKNASGFGDASNDITPYAAQQLYLFQHRRQLSIDKPDFDADMSIGGPVPVISEYMGNLRFNFSFRRNYNNYLIPLSTSAYIDQSYQLKVTSDLAEGMKFTIDGLLSRQTGSSRSALGAPQFYTNPEQISVNLSRFSNFKTSENRMFATDYFTPLEVNRKNLGIKLTHAINNSTFYEIVLTNSNTHYDTYLGRSRDTNRVYQFGNLFVDEGPFGFTPEQTFTGINNFRMSVGFSNGRDTSIVNSTTIKADITNQYNKYNEFKAGVEFVTTDQKLRAGSIDKFLPSGRYLVQWDKTPSRGSLYFQDKIEYEGMIANIGLRFDYSSAGGSWIDYDVYSKAFGSPSRLDTLPTSKVKAVTSLSPRIGIAFPITENSKLFFNYGHFRSMPDPMQLYFTGIYSDETKQVFRLADPENPFPKTVAYELGFEQNAFDMFLTRIAGYYKDVSEQGLLTTYINNLNNINYSKYEPNSYEDIRGFEISVSKNRGEWIQGFVNYTYMVATSGRFHYSSYDANPGQQLAYENTTTVTYQDKPIPQPYARISLDFFTPNEWGPEYLGIFPLGDWRMNLLGTWRAGEYFSWTGGSGSTPGIQNNVQWTDFYNFDLRLSKSFKVAMVNCQFFVDINNVLNIKRMTGPGYAFIDEKDYLSYMQSLHLSKDDFEGFAKDPVTGDPKPGYSNTGTPGQFVFGDDRPGDYRKGDYIAWDENASESLKSEWRKNKSYIDMPNQDYLTFLNPRDVYIGFKFNVELH